MSVGVHQLKFDSVLLMKEVADKIESYLESFYDPQMPMAACDIQKLDWRDLRPDHRADSLPTSSCHHEWLASAHIRWLWLPLGPVSHTNFSNPALRGAPAVRFAELNGRIVSRI